MKSGFCKSIISFFVFFVLFCGHNSVLAQNTLSSQKTDFGWAWQNPLPQGNPLYSIHFAKDNETGYAVGSDSTILKTKDGGFHWEKQTSYINNVTFSGVVVFDEKNALVVGARGTVLSTTDGGSYWKPVAVDTRDHLYGISFAGSEFKTGWICGTYGRILKTIDGGLTWKVQTSGTNEHLLKISAFDDTHAVGVAPIPGWLVVPVRRQGTHRTGSAGNRPLG